MSSSLGLFFGLLNPNISFLLPLHFTTKLPKVPLPSLFLSSPQNQCLSKTATWSCVDFQIFPRVSASTHQRFSNNFDLGVSFLLCDSGFKLIASFLSFYSLSSFSCTDHHEDLQEEHETQLT